MQLPTQQQFVADCLSKYWFTDIPADQQWEEAHFPLPSCSDEDNTVMLWSADHTVQGLLQSVELDHRCFYYKANSKDLYNLETYYPQYLQLFAQLKSQFSSRQGKIGGRTSGRNAVMNKTGIHAPGMASKGGKKVAELGVGCHAPGMASKGGKIGGKKAVVINQANGTNAFFDPKIQSANGKATSAQQWQCLVTDHVSTPGGLSNYQRARGIDTSLRVRRLDLEG